MSTIPKDKATPSQMITHRRMQQIFTKHRDKFDKHRDKGPAFAKRLDDLERDLFGEQEADN